MCGIAGYFITHSNRIRAKALHLLSQQLLLEIEHRGKDATGYAYVSIKDKCAKIAKAPVAARDFLTIPGHLLSQDSISRMPRSMLLHTRFATQGLADDNKNNHPVYSKLSGLCMVHNGWIIDDQEVVERFNLTKDGDVDSETYLRLIERFYIEQKDTQKSLALAIDEANVHVAGNFACAMVQGGRPNTMWIWRDVGDLCVVQTDFGFVFASKQSAVINALYYACSALDCATWKVLSVPAATFLQLTLEGVQYTNIRPIDFSRHLSSVYKVSINGETRYRKHRVASYNCDLEYSDYEYGGRSSATFYHPNNCGCVTCVTRNNTRSNNGSSQSPGSSFHSAGDYAAVSTDKQPLLSTVDSLGARAQDKIEKAQSDHQSETGTYGEGETLWKEE